MMFIEKDYKIWSGDVTWLVAQSIIIHEKGIPITSEQFIIQDGLARKLLDTNAGDIWKP